MARKVCFLSEDGKYYICNAREVNGRLIFTTGKWFKIPAKQNESDPAK